MFLPFRPRSGVDGTSLTYKTGRCCPFARPLNRPALWLLPFAPQGHKALANACFKFSEPGICANFAQQGTRLLELSCIADRPSGRRREETLHGSLRLYEPFAGPAGRTHLLPLANVLTGSPEIPETVPKVLWPARPVADPGLDPQVPRGVTFPVGDLR